MNGTDVPAIAPHPEEMRAGFEIHVGGRTVVSVTARTTPAGILSIGTLVSAILLSTAVLVSAAGRARRRW